MVRSGMITLVDITDIDTIENWYLATDQSSDVTTLTPGWTTTIQTMDSSHPYLWNYEVIKGSNDIIINTTEPVIIGRFGSDGAQGEQGIPGEPGQQGIQGVSVLRTEIEYYKKTRTGLAPTSDSIGTTSIPNYEDGCIYYKRSVTYLDNNTKINGDWVEDTTLTNEIANAYNAWVTAGTVEQRTRKIINNINGITVVGGITGTTISDSDTSTYGYNTIMAPNYLGLRYNAINLTKLTTTGLDFYIPTLNSDSQPIQGAKGLEITSNAITFYNPYSENHEAQLIIGANGALQSGNFSYTDGQIFSFAGTKIDLVDGNIYSPSFRVVNSSNNSGAYIRGDVVAQTGKFGNSNNNYWIIDTFYDANRGDSYSSLHSKGESFIQLGDNNTWTFSTDRISSAWRYMSTNADGVTNPYYFRYKQFEQNGLYYEYGMHIPSILNTQDVKQTRLSDKFLFIRHANNVVADDFLNILENTESQWTYPFYVDSQGNVRAQGFYIGNSDTSIGGGAGTIAERLNAPHGNATQPIYFDDNGRAQNTTYQLNAAGAKAVVESIVDSGQNINSNSTDLPTTAAIVNYINNKGYISSYTDENVATSPANTTKLWIVGTPINGSTIGELKYDTNVYLNTTAGDLRATTFNGRTLRAASERNVDTNISLENPSSSYLPTSQAVANYIESLEYATLSDLAEQVAAESRGIGYGLTSHETDGRTYVDLPFMSQGAQDIQAIYPITIDRFGKINSYGTAITPLTTESVINNAPTLDWGDTYVIGSVGGTNLTVTMPSNPNDHYIGYIRAGSSNSINNAATTSGNTYINFIENGTRRSGVKLIPGNNMTITSDGNGNITFSSAAGTSYTVDNKNATLDWNNSTTIATVAGTDITVSLPTVSGLGVSSVRVNGISPVISSVDTAQTASLDTSISLASGYGDIQNPYTSKTRGFVLASPANIAGAPSFRALVESDIPNLTVSKISDFPTTWSYSSITGTPTALPNPNPLRINVYTGNSTTTPIDYNGSVNETINVAGANAITSISTSPGANNETVFTVTTASGGTSSFTASITATVASGANKLTDSNNNGLNVSGPVSFSDGLPVTMLPNISTGAFLKDDGTWGVPSSAVSAQEATYATYDSSEINNSIKVAIVDKFISKSIGTAKGDIIYWSGNGTPVRLGASTNGYFLKLVNGVPTWAADNNDDTNYYHTTGSWSGLTYTAASHGGAGELRLTIPIGTSASTVAAGNHIHGNISNTGDIADNVNTQIATGDRLIIRDKSANNITNTSIIFDTTETSKFLTQAGTWAAATFDLGIAKYNSVGGVKPWFSTTGTSSLSSGSDTSYNGNVVVNGRSTVNGKYYAVESDAEGRLFVNVPWVLSDSHDVAMVARDNNKAYLLGTIDSPSNVEQNVTTVAETGVYFDTTAATLVANTFKGSLSGIASGNITSVQYDSTNSKFTYTKNNNNTDIITIANLKTAMALNNVENIKLSTWNGSNNITTVGTIDSGIWSGNTIAVNKGGTGKTSWTQYGVLYASGTTTLTNTAAGAVNTVLMGKGSAAPTFVSVNPSISVVAGTNDSAPQINLSVLGINGTAQALTIASTSTYGVTKLSSTVSSTEQNMAATPKLVYDTISGANDTYVTLNTAQTLTNNAIKTYLGQQIYGTNGLILGTTNTNGSTVTQKANIKYDSNFEAIVFTFA